MIKKITYDIESSICDGQKGKKLAGLLSVNLYEYLIDELEMKEDIALYKKVKADKKENYIPLQNT
jgi:hypothetical protein